MLFDYLVCALWSSIDDNEEPFDKNYTIDDFSHEAIRQATEDCRAFAEQCLEVGINLDDFNEEQVGHDFWLGRNYHGSSFWDRPEVYNGQENADKLTSIAQSFGEKHIYVDNGKLFFE